MNRCFDVLFKCLANLPVTVCVHIVNKYKQVRIVLSVNPQALTLLPYRVIWVLIPYRVIGVGCGVFRIDVPLAIITKVLVYEGVLYSYIIKSSPLFDEQPSYTRQLAFLRVLLLKVVSSVNLQFFNCNVNPAFHYSTVCTINKIVYLFRLQIYSYKGSVKHTTIQM